MLCACLSPTTVSTARERLAFVTFKNLHTPTTLRVVWYARVRVCVYRFGSHTARAYCLRIPLSFYQPRGSNVWKPAHSSIAHYSTTDNSTTLHVKTPQHRACSDVLWRVQFPQLHFHSFFSSLFSPLFVVCHSFSPWCKFFVAIPVVSCFLPLLSSLCASVSEPVTSFYVLAWLFYFRRRIAVTDDGQTLAHGELTWRSQGQDYDDDVALLLTSPLLLLSLPFCVSDY